MMKLTKRKAFSFLRSYFDVLNDIPEDKDKLDFLIAIINKQFIDEEPKNLSFITKLCYNSQRHSIEKSVKGWKLASNTDMLGSPMSGPGGEGEGSPMSGPMSDPKEEQEQEKGKEEYIYTEKEFLEDWKKVRLHFHKVPTNIKKLKTFESSCFDSAIKDFSKEDIRNAMQCLFKQEVQDIKSMFLQPRHFLENVEKYHNAHISKEYKLYGSKKIKYEL